MKSPATDKPITDQLTVDMSSYREVRVIGIGGMAKVYEGRDEQLERPVAIKVLSDDFAQDKAFVELFLAEARKMASLSHPNILPIYAIDTSRSSPRLILELADGGTLKERLAQGPFYAEEAIDLLEHLLGGLGEIHRQGMQHRDLKPANILRSKNTYKISDFGIAKAGDDRTLPFVTPRYVAPEVMLHPEQAGPRSDLYSLGLLTYEALLGAERFAQVVDEASNEAPGASAIDVGEGSGPSRPWSRMPHSIDLPPLHTLDPQVSPELSTLIHKMIDRDPRARYQSCDEVLTDLRRLKQPSDDTLILPEGRLAPTRPWLKIVLGTFLVLALALAALFLLPTKHFEIDIISDPAGAQIVHQGQRVAETPIKGLRVRPGTTLILHKDGYAEASVDVVSVAEPLPSIVLRWEPIEIASDPVGAVVLEAGEAIGRTPFEWAGEGGARRELVLELDGFESENIILEPGAERVEVRLRRAAFRVERVSDAATLVAELQRFSSPPGELELTVEGGAGQILPLGAELRFRVASREAGFLMLFAVSSDGQILLFYPNSRRAVLDIGGGESVVLPLAADRAQGFTLTISPPVGRDRIFALWSSRPLPAPPVGDTAQPWLTIYPWRAAASRPAVDFASWVSELRRERPHETRLSMTEIEVVER